jgi:parallel beta-helix repeat protein
MSKKGVAQYLFIGAIVLASVIFLISSIEFKNEVFFSGTHSYDAGDLFAITGRTTTVGGGGNQSTLIVFDNGDPEGGSRPINLVSQIKFFANYTNTTSGVNITGANCIINFTGQGAVMSYNATSTFYEHNRTFTTAGVQLYNVSCSATGYEQLNTTGENISVSHLLNTNSCADFVPVNTVHNVTINLTGNATGSGFDNSFCFWMQGENTTLNCNGFTVTDSDGGDGEEGVFASAKQATVQNCKFVNFSYALDIDAAPFSRIFNVTILDASSNAIVFGPASNSPNTLINNITAINSGGVGDGSIVVKTSDNITISNVRIINVKGSGVSGFFISGSDRFNLTSATVENATDHGIEITNSKNMTIKNVFITQSDTDGINVLVTSSDFSVINSTIFNNSGDGIDSPTTSTDNVFIFNNNISYNGATGITIFSDDISNTTNNYLKQNAKEGILITNGHKLVIINNTFIGNGNNTNQAPAISLSSAGSDNTISGNTVLNSPFGINVAAGPNINDTITNNVIDNASIAGISLTSVSRNNSISDNNVSNSLTGIFIRNAQNVSVRGNELLNNTFSINSSVGFDLFIEKSSGTLNYKNVTGLIRDIVNNVVVSTSIISINSSVEQPLNKSANLTLNFQDQCPVTLYFLDAFTTDSNLAINNGQACNDASTPSCTAVTCSEPTVTFNVQRFSTYAVQGTPAVSGGGSGRQSGPRCAPVTTTCGDWSSCINGQQTRICRVNIGICYSYDKAETQGCGVIPPVVEQPLSSGLQPQDVAVNPYACILVNNISVSQESVKPSTAPLPKIKEGFEAILSPFSVSCEQPSLSLTLAIPDNYGDVEALRCRGTKCRKVSFTRTEQLSCGSPLFEDLSRTTEYLDPEFFPIQVSKIESSTGQLEVSGNKMLFTGLQGTVSLEASSEPVREALNPGIRIIGTPVVLTFSETNTNIATTITLPYVLPEKIDEFSVAIYALKEDKWDYLGGIVNTEKDTVTVSVTDITKYTENNKVTLAVMGLPCLTCFETEFKKVYEGRSRDAVILVHGFENTPKRFTDIINDIRLTNQPWQAWTFGYPSHQSINETAREFADLVQAQAREFDYLYIASHSMGGLVAQQMLRYAYDENKRIPGSYSFVNRIKKVIIIAAPNKGTLSKGVYQQLFDLLLNSKIVQGLFNLNSRVLNELIEGKTIERVPGIEYFVIAGTEPYPFTRDLAITNDGIVSLDSAQTIGTEPIVNKCDNYWELKITHTDILDNYDSRRVVERIVAKEIADSLQEKPVMGFNQYYELNVNDCSPSDTFVVIGKNVPEASASVPGLCGCGNNFCGLDENEVNCPSDCAVIRKPFPFVLLWTLLALIVVISLLILLLTRKKKEKPEVITKEKGEDEQLSYLLTQTRINLRLNDLNQAAVFYNRFNSAYDVASFDVKQRFKDSAEDIKKEVRRKLTT